MSAIRTNRAIARSGRFITPYTRWFSRIFGIQTSEESEEHVKSSTSTEKGSTSAGILPTSQTLTLEHQTFNLESNRNHRPQLTPVKYSNASKTPSSSASPPDVEMNSVASFLSQSAGQSVSAEEVEGMLAILRGNTPPESREIFRFSSSTPTRDLQSSPSTPSSMRKKLPRNPNGVYRWEGAGSAKHTHPRNRYASPVFGASPSKPDRSAMKESVVSQETPLPDSKRRKVGDESPSSSVSTQRPVFSESTARKVPFPSTASPTAGSNGATNRPNPLPSPSRLRTPVKPTAPVVPSPLRQTWSDTSSTSSQNDTRKSPSQTKTANFMAELIKETTPPKKPDLANPYQVASPIGKVGPPRRSTKRPRATGRPVAPTPAEIEEEKRKQEEIEEKGKLKECSPQAIIEATVPKGSQRSRPPAHFEKSTDTSIAEEESSHESPRSQREAPVVLKTRKIPYVVEEVDGNETEEVRRFAKRAKHSINGHGPVPSAAERSQIAAPEPEILILEDFDMDAAEHKEKTKEQLKLIIPIDENGPSTSSTSTSPTNALSPTVSRNKLSSAPKEPSKLRFSFQPEGTPAPFSPAPKSAALPVPSPGLQKSEFKFEPLSSNFSFAFKPTDLAPSGSTKPQEQAKKVKVQDTSDEDIKTKARRMTASSLPTFVITSSATSVLPSSADAARIQGRVNSLPVSSLPNFELSSSGPSKPFSFGFDPANPKPRSSFTFGPSPPKIFGNNSSPKLSATFTSDNNSPKPSGMFSFGVTGTSTPPPFVPPAVPVIKAFDFAAAGMTAPSNNLETWICSCCVLSNPRSALKCQTCDAPNGTSPVVAVVPPAPSPAPTLAPLIVPAIKAFDFAAAGMKAPSVAPGTWICPFCSLANPMSANQCETCENIRSNFS